MLDFWEALINPSIALSGFVGAIIIWFFTNAKIKNNPFRFFISHEESQLLSGWAKLFRIFYLSFIITFFTSIYSIFVASIDLEYKYAWVHKAMVKLINPSSFLVTIVILLTIIVLLCIENVQKKLTEGLYSQSSTGRKRSVFIIATVVFILIYSLFFIMFYGVLVNESLIRANKEEIEFSHSFFLLFKIHLLDNSIIGELLALTILYYMALYPISKVSKFLGRSEVIVNIYLKSGKCFEGKYLLNANVDDGVLICDSNNMFDQNKHLIPKANIDYISFKRTYYSLGKEVAPESSSILITSSEFNDDEKELVKSMLRKK